MINQLPSALVDAIEPATAEQAFDAGTQLHDFVNSQHKRYPSSIVDDDGVDHLFYKEPAERPHLVICASKVKDPVSEDIMGVSLDFAEWIPGEQGETIIQSVEYGVRYFGRGALLLTRSDGVEIDGPSLDHSPQEIIEAYGHTDNELDEDIKLWLRQGIITGRIQAVLDLVDRHDCVERELNLEPKLVTPQHIIQVIGQVATLRPRE